MTDKEFKKYILKKYKATDVKINNRNGAVNVFGIPPGSVSQCWYMVGIKNTIIENMDSNFENYQLRH